VKTVIRKKQRSGVILDEGGEKKGGSGFEKGIRAWTVSVLKKRIV